MTAVGVMCYALWTYHWRAASISRGGKGPYDDRLGPVSIPKYFEIIQILISAHQTILCASLLGNFNHLHDLQYPDHIPSRYHLQFRSSIHQLITRTSLHDLSRFLNVPHYRTHSRIAHINLPAKFFQLQLFIGFLSSQKS